MMRKVKRGVEWRKLKKSMIEAKSSSSAQLSSFHQKKKKKLKYIHIYLLFLILAWKIFLNIICRIEVKQYWVELRSEKLRLTSKLKKSTWSRKKEKWRLLHYYEKKREKEGIKHFYEWPSKEYSEAKRQKAENKMEWETLSRRKLIV